MRLTIRNGDAGGREEWIGCLDLSQGLTGGKSIDESSIRVGCNLEEVIALAGSEVIAADSEPVVERRIVRRIHTIGERIVEDAHPTPDHNGMRYPEWLPRETGSGCPHKTVGALQTLPL